MSGVINGQDAWLAGPSADGLSPFPAIGPVVSRTDCAYCDTTVDFPTVIPDPPGNGGYIMFFSAGHALSGGGSVAEIGRASSARRAATSRAEPAPVLSSDLTGEAVLLAPRVIVDGTVFKMWYSYARAQDIMDLSNLCNDKNHVQIGYATSSDGFYWIRSPSNPAVAVGGTGWDAASQRAHRRLGRAARRQIDEPPASRSTTRPSSPCRSCGCLPSGIGRATRP